MAGQVITKVSANSGTHLISTSFYGTCTTAAGTAAKAVIINDTNITDAITLVNGMTLAVKFVNSNSVANPTITVYNNSGTAAAPTQGSTTLIAAKSIYQVNTNLDAAGTAASTSAATSWKAGATVIFVYDGQGWVEASSTYNQDNNTTALTSMSGTLAVNHGGTGVTSNTVNSVLVGGTTTTGAIQNVAAASGALYSTGANVKPTFGTLPIAQGGTGKTTATEAWTALGGGAIGKKATLSASDIPSLSGTYLPLSGGNLTGNLSMSSKWKWTVDSSNNLNLEWIG